MRVSVMDFGKKFMVRILLYSSAFFAIYLVFAIIMILNYLKFIDLNLEIIV